MIEKFMKYFTTFTAASTVIPSTSAMTVSLNTIKGSTITGGCGNIFEYTEKSTFEIPGEIGKGQPNCLFGDGTLRNICTGKTLKTIDLQKNNLKIKPDNSIPSDGTYEIQAGTVFPESKNLCGYEIKIKRNIPIFLKKGQKVIFTGDGKVVDRISGEEVKQLEKDDYELIKVKNEKILSNEEMAKVYKHNREDEEKNIMQPTTMKGVR